MSAFCLRLKADGPDISHERTTQFAGGPACHGPSAKLSPFCVASGPGPADIASEDPVFQPRPVPALSFVQRARAEAGRRSLGLGLTLLVQMLLLFLLLTLGRTDRVGREDGRSPITSFFVEQVSPEADEPRPPEPEQRAEERPAMQRPEPEQAPTPQPAEPVAPLILPTPQPMPAPVVAPPGPSRPPQQSRPVYGPPDRRSAASTDTERVGTAPNGEPLYAASWYREPSPEAMRAYLSTARGPGWGLIACRTVPDYRVEDCVALGEYPEGSQITRSMLAAAWELRVRPPRLGGRPLVGAWVRIRFDYALERR